MIHIMHDIECLALVSTKPVLLSLGAVKFNADGIHDRFHVRIDPDTCQQMGLELEASTVDWWMDPERAEARAQLYAMPKIDVLSALDGFTTWVRETPEDERGSAWSNGSNFDNTRLKCIYQHLATYGIEWPFSYKQEECYRTMRNRFGQLAEFVRSGVHHGALDDAESQAMHMIAMNKALPEGFNL